MSRGSYVPPAVLLGLVLGTAVLLIAGYGIPVGVGVLVGIAIGILATFAVVVAARGGAGRSSGQSSFALHRSEPGHDMIRQHGQQSMRVAGVDQSPLLGVIAIGSGVDAGGTRLELVALELRRDGCVGLLAAEGTPPAGPLGHLAEVTVSDDVGTSYVAAAQAESGGVTTSRVTLRFAPSPPPTARLLTVTLLRFVDPFQGGAETVGPWVFAVNLPES